MLQSQYKYLKEQNILSDSSETPLYKEMQIVISQYRAKYLPISIIDKLYFSCDEVLCKYIFLVAQTKVEERLCSIILILLQFRDYMLRNAPFTYAYSAINIPIFTNGFYHFCREKIAKKCFGYRRSLFLQDTIILDEVKNVVAELGRYLIENGFSEYQMVSK